MNGTPPYPTNTPPGSPPSRLMTLGSPLLNVSNISRRNSNNFSNANNVLGNLSRNNNNGNKNKAYSTSRSLNSSNFYNRNRSTTAPRNNNTNNSRNNNKRNVNYKALIGKLNRKSRSTRRQKRRQSRK